MVHHTLGSLNQRYLSNIVWAYVTVNVSHRGLFGRVIEQMMMRGNLRDKSPGTLANILWALSTSKLSRIPLFDEIGNELVSCRDLESFDPRSLSKTAYAFATARVPNQILFEQIAEAAIVRKDDFCARGVADLLWAFSSAGFAQKNLLWCWAWR